MMNFTLHTTFPDDLRQEWNTLLAESITHVPFLRHEYLQAWWKHRGGGEWPDAKLAIVTARQDGSLVGIAPLFYTPNHQGQPVLMLLGSIEISDYLDLIVRPADLDVFTAGLLTFLPTAALPAWRSLDLYNLLDSSPTLAALQRAAGSAGLTYSQAALQHSPYIPLPGDWDTYLASIDKKQRHEIRRKMRRLEETDVPTRWYITSDPAEFSRDLDDFIALMEQDAEKAIFLTPVMRVALREIAECGFNEGCLQLSFLEVNGKKAAGYLSFDYLNRLWIYNSGFDRSSMEYSPGWVLLGYLLQWANQNQHSEFDFMRGDEDYKYRFGAVDRQVMRATLSQTE